MTSYRIPDWAIPSVGSAAGVPWGISQRIESLNWYHGIYPNSAQLFDLPAGKVLMYEAKLDIDGDGSGGDKSGGKDTYLPDTSLHGPDGKPLNSYAYPFMVIPLPNQHGASDWLGRYLALGDLGMAFYRGRSVAYVYGDAGPRIKLGEGSIMVASALGINSNPVSGGLQGVPPSRGVIHVAFPKTAANVTEGRLKTDYTRDMVKLEAGILMQRFLGR